PIILLGCTNRPFTAGGFFMSPRFVLLLLTSALAVVLGLWSFPSSLAVQIVSKAGYWIILFATVWFAVVLMRSLRDVSEGLQAWRSWIIPAAIAVGVAGFFHVHEPHDYKIVADEVVLGLTAKQMHFAREAAVTVRGYEYAGNYTDLVTYVDKRPLFFPFVLA